MTRNEAIFAIAEMILLSEDQTPILAAKILRFIERNRMSKHAADEWEPESDEA